MSTDTELTVEVPAEVEVTYTDKVLTMKGEKGELKKKLFFPGLGITVEGKTVKITQRTPTRKFKRVSRTFESHIKNMIRGVTEGWKAELKVVYSHFPMTVKVEGDTFKVTNFIGGSHPKTAKIPNTKVTTNKINGQAHHGKEESLVTISANCSSAKATPDKLMLITTSKRIKETILITVSSNADYNFNVKVIAKI